MHPRESASGERCPRPPLGIPAWEKLPDAPTAAAPHTRLHRLRTALKASHRLRLPRPLFWGGCKYGTSLHHEDASDTVSPTEVRQRPRTQCKKQGRFYLLAEPFRCPTIGEPLTVPMPKRSSTRTPSLRHLRRETFPVSKAFVPKS